MPSLHVIKALIKRVSRAQVLESIRSSHQGRAAGWAKVSGTERSRARASFLDSAVQQFCGAWIGSGQFKLRIMRVFAMY